MAKARFTPNPKFSVQLRRDPRMRQFVAKVADEGAEQTERRLPYPNILGGLEVSSRTEQSRDGWEGQVRVKGPGWHLWEFGTQNNPARPAMRPGVQAALSRYGGRLGQSR